MDDEIAESLLASIHDDRLVLMVGAGLSMGNPSSLPSAVKLAQNCTERHRARYGANLPVAVSSDLESLAEYFEARGGGELEKIFIGNDVPWSDFRSAFNDGHEAVADFLYARIVAFTLSTNYDFLIEEAAANLDKTENIVSSLDGEEASDGRPHNPFLKLHGCMVRDQKATLWCASQTNREPIKSRLRSSGPWVHGNLMGKDVVLVGFWTDWNYLNTILNEVVENSTPRRVVLVDPQEEAALRDKAPDLWNWAHSENVTFHHVREYGECFLEELRVRYGRRFIFRSFDQANELYSMQIGDAFDVDRKTPRLDSQRLYGLRRALTGTLRHMAVREKDATKTSEPAAVVVMRLIEKGATVGEEFLDLEGKRIRVVAGNGPLSYSRAKYGLEPPPPESPDIVICAGAQEDHSLPNVVRAAQPPSQVRPGESGKWITDLQAVNEVFG